MASRGSRRGNSRRQLSQKRPSHRSLRSIGGRCQKSRAALLQERGARRLPSLGARLLAPTVSPAMKLFERSISSSSPNAKLPYA